MFVAGRLASAPIYEKAKIPVIAVGTGTPDISKAGDYIFRTIPNLSVAAEKLYHHAKSHYKHVAFLSQDTAYAQGLEKSFREENKDFTLKISSETVPPNALDVRSVLLKLKARDPDVLFLNPQTEESMIIMYRQLQEMKWKIPLYATYFPSFKKFLETFGQGADGIIFADLPFLGSAIDTDGKALYEEYRKQKGDLKSTEFYFVTVLAAFSTLHEAITHTKTNVKDYLYQTKFSGPFGTFSFDPAGDIHGERLTFVLKTLRHGIAVPFP